MRAVALILAFLTSALAYQVLVPNASQGWTNQGGQPFSWQRVSTDPLNFTVVLDNQSISGYTPQVLAALVDGTLGSTTLNPPSGGWTTGTNFRINLVQDPNDLSTIYAQSVDFSITQGNGTTSSSATVPATTFVTTTSSTSTGTGTDSGQVAPTGSTSSGALATYSANAGAIAFLSLLAYSLA